MRNTLSVSISFDLDMIRASPFAVALPCPASPRPESLVSETWVASPSGRNSSKIRLSPVHRVIWQHLPSSPYLNLSSKRRIYSGRRFEDSVIRRPIRSACLDATGGVVAVTLAAAATSACVSHRPSSRPALYRQAAANPDGLTPATAPVDSDCSANRRELAVGCSLEYRVLTQAGDEFARANRLGRQSEFCI